MTRSPAENTVLPRADQFLLSALPAIMGLDRQTYGPFDAGAITELPPDIVAILAARSAIDMI